MKAVPSLLLCALCVLSHTLWFAQSADICVDPLNGNDALCNVQNSCSLSPCKTLTQSVNLAAREGDTIKAIDNGAFNEVVQIVAKAVHFQANPSGNHLTGSLHWSGNCSGYSSVNGFTIQFDGQKSAVSFSGATYSQVDLNVTVAVDVIPPNNTVGIIDLIDFESTDKDGPIPNSWTITFTTTLPKVPYVQLFNVATPQKMKPGVNDLNLSAFLHGPFVPFGNFSGYNAGLIFKSVNPTPESQTKAFLNIQNCTGLGLIFEAAWPVEVNLKYVNVADVTLAANIDSLLVAHSNNVTLLNQAHIGVGNLHLESVRSFAAQNLQNTPIFFTNDFMQGDVTLGVLLENLNNCTLHVDAGNGTATPTNFNVVVRNSIFTGLTTQNVIYNPYTEAPIDAMQNYFGPSGPYTTCNSQGTGPSVGPDNHVYYGRWCLTVNCTTFDTGSCGLPLPSPPPTPTPTPTPGTPTPTPTSPTPTPTVPEHHDGISAGGIVGIVFGVLAVVILAGVAVWYIKFRKSDYSAI